MKYLAEKGDEKDNHRRAVALHVEKRLPFLLCEGRWNENGALT